MGLENEALGMYLVGEFAKQIIVARHPPKIIEIFNFELSKRCLLKV